MNHSSVRSVRVRTVTVALVSVAALSLAGCSEGLTPVERAQAQVSAKEKALTEAQTDFTTASADFCDASKTYILALDQYGDILTSSAPTVGDVKSAGADLADPGADARDSAAAAADAQQSVATAQQDLAEAQAALQQAEAGSTEAPAEPAASPSPSPLAPAATIDRVTQAEAEFADAQAAITDETSLADASEQFNSAAVALEMAWLRLFAETGCIPDEQQEQAAAAVVAYTTALQQDLAAAGYYAEAVDGVYGPATVAAVEELQRANGLSVTGTVDKATAEALQAELLALGGAAAQESIATTAALQQTLKLAGFWDGPVDGVWTPALTEAVQAFQVELGVEPTGTVDAATIAAFQQAISDLQQGQSEAIPSPEPSESEGP